MLRGPSFRVRPLLSRFSFPLAWVAQQSATGEAVHLDQLASMVSGPGTAYVVNVLDGTVLPIDTSSDVAGSLISLGTTGCNGADIVIAPDADTAYVTDACHNLVIPIDLLTNTAEAPITLSSGPSSIAITPDGSTAYVTEPSADAVVPITLSDDAVGVPIPLPDPTSIVISPDGLPTWLMLFLPRPWRGSSHP